MSGETPIDEGADGLDVLAGEYVLGLLDEAAANAVLARSQADPQLAAAIAAWQERFDPLADLPAPVAPQERLWTRIEAGLKSGPAPSAQVVALPSGARARSDTPPARVAGPWRGLAVASMALAACLAAFIVWTRMAPAEAPAEARAAALLATPGAAAAALRAQVTSAGTITIVPLQHLTVAPGRRLGFWAWPASEKAPVLLGMISADGGQLKFPYPAREGTPVMVTSEPQGATGSGPGPTLYLGLLVVSRG